MGIIQALKNDWKRLTTKEGWQSIQDQANGVKKVKGREMMYKGEPVVALNPINPEYKLSSAYHGDVMVPRWKAYRKVLAPLDVETMEDEHYPEVLKQLQHYRNLAISAPTQMEREKATIEEVYYIGCQTVLDSEIEEWTEEVRLKKMKYYNLL